MSNKNTQFSFIKKYLSGEAHFGFWNIIQKAIGVINGFFILSTLTVYQYGVFQLLLSLYGIFSDIGSLGVNVVNNDISREIASGNESRAKRIFKEYFTARLILGIILFCLFFFGASFFSTRYNIDFIKEIRIISFLFLTDFAFYTFNYLLTIRLEFAIVAARSSVYKITQLIILSYFYYSGKGIGIGVIILSMICASIISIISLLGPFIRVYGKWKGVEELPGHSLLINIFRTYGKWDIFRYAVSRGGARLQPWLIKIFVSTEAVAIYTVANTILGVLKDAIPAKTLQSLIPLQLEDRDRMQRIFTYGVKYATLWAIILAVGGYIAVPPLIYLLFPKYIEAVPYLFLMLAGLPLWAAGLMAGIYLIALRKQKFMFFHNTLRSIWSSAVYLVTLPFIGIWGAALERVLSPIFLTLIFHKYMQKYSPGIYFDFKTFFSFTQEDKTFLQNVKREILTLVLKKIKRPIHMGQSK